MNRTDYSQHSRVRNAPLTAQLDPARFHSCDAMRRATPNLAAKEAMAEALGVSVSMVEKQQRPYGGTMDTGRRNIFDRQLKAINKSIAAGVGLYDAVAGQIWILRKLGLRVTTRGAAVEVEAHQVAANIARDSADLAAFIMEAIADNRLDLGERQGIQERIERCIVGYLGAESFAEVQAQ